MVWSKNVRIVAIICGTILCMTILVTAAVSGAEMNPEAIIGALLTGIGALLTGMGIASGPSPE